MAEVEGDPHEQGLYMYVLSARWHVATRHHGTRHVSTTTRPTALAMCRTSHIARRATLNVCMCGSLHPNVSTFSFLRDSFRHGNVGCGKTMLMDMAYHTMPYERKKRV